MNATFRIIVAFLLLVLESPAYPERINDPLADFLNLPLEGRFSDISELARVRTYSVDVNGDGNTEIFVGSAQPWNGDSVQLVCAVYASTEDGYIRLTSPQRGVNVNPRFFGERKTSYCGFFDELKEQGLLIVERDLSTAAGLEQPIDGRFYYVRNGQLVVDELGAIDPRHPAGEALITRYFDEALASRPIRSEEYTLERLKELGYTIPDWKHPPPLTPVQSPPINPQSSKVDSTPVSSTSTTGSLPATTSSVGPRVETNPNSGNLALVALAVLIVGGVGAMLFFSRHRPS